MENLIINIEVNYGKNSVLRSDMDEVLSWS